MIYDDIYSFKVGRVSESREKGKGGEERREREREERTSSEAQSQEHSSVPGFAPFLVEAGALIERK